MRQLSPWPDNISTLSDDAMPTLVCSQNAAAVSLANLSEMQSQQDHHDKLMAKAVLSASDQKASFDSQMAKATQDADVMRTAYEKLKCANATTGTPPPLGDNNLSSTG